MSYVRKSWSTIGFKCTFSPEMGEKQVCSYVHSSKEYLLDAFYVPGTVLDAWYIKGKTTTAANCHSRNLHFSVWKRVCNK